MTETAIHIQNSHNGHPNGNHQQQPPQYLINFHKEYFKTREGLLKVLQLVRNATRCFVISPKSEGRREDLVAVSISFSRATYVRTSYVIA